MVKGVWGWTFRVSGFGAKASGSLISIKNRAPGTPRLLRLLRIHRGSSLANRPPKDTSEPKALNPI